MGKHAARLDYSGALAELGARLQAEVGRTTYLERCENRGVPSLLLWFGFRRAARRSAAAGRGGMTYCTACGEVW